MVRGVGLPLLMTVTLAAGGVIGSSSGGAAQSERDRSGIVLAQADQQKKATPAARTAPAAKPAPAARPAPATRTAPPRQAPAARPAPTTPAPPARIVTPRVVTPAITPNVAAPSRRGPSVVGPAGVPARALSIRGASRATIAGRNFSVWRGSYRVRRGGYWRTFVPLATLSAIFFGPVLYYPYAYVDAPDDYCQGWTEDGCQLQWQSVQTLEGPTEYQCVAYCPRE